MQKNYSFCKGKWWRKGKQTSGTFLFIDKLTGICFSVSVELSLDCKIALKPPCWFTVFEYFKFFCNTVWGVSGFVPSFLHLKHVIDCSWQKNEKVWYLKNLKEKLVCYAEVFRLDVSKRLLAALIGSALSPSLRVFFAVGIGATFLGMAMLRGVDVAICWFLLGGLTRELKENMPKIFW